MWRGILFWLLDVCRVGQGGAWRGTLLYCIAWEGHGCSLLHSSGQYSTLRIRITPPLLNTPPGCPPPVQREQKDRDKAWRAAGKQAKPLWEEDGKRRGLLDKYDEEEEEMMQVGRGGADACGISLGIF